MLRPGHWIREKPYATTVFDKTAPIVAPMVMITELSAYSPLVPDGSNWKATMMIEYKEVDERRVALSRMIGIEDRVWIQVEGCPRVYAIADEDLDRETEEKNSAVQFLRFELDRYLRML